MATLYEISSELAAIVAMIDEAGGEITPEVERQLDALNGDLATKVERLDRWRRNLESDAVAITSEVGRLRFMSDVVGRRLDWLKSFIRRGMDMAGVRKLGGATWGVTVCNNSQASVTVDATVDVDELPAKFRTETRTVTVDRQAILAAHEAGEKLPKGITVNRGQHARFK